MSAPPAYGSAPPGYPSDNKGYPSDNKGYPVEKPQQKQQQMPPAGPSYSAAYACVLLSSTDRVRLLNFPPHVPQAVQNVLKVAWPPGIQGTIPLEYGGIEYKLKGNPWYGQGAEAVPARRLLIHLFHGLALQGWHLAASSDLTKKTMDKDTLFFRSGPPIQRVFFSVSFNETDKIRLIDSPNEPITTAFRQTVGAWPFGVQSEKEKEYGCTQFKLRGNPWWTSNGAQVSQARMLALQLLTVMDNMGYELAASVDMSCGSGDNSSDIDSWFFASKIM